MYNVHVHVRHLQIIAAYSMEIYQMGEYILLELSAEGVENCKGG